AGTNVLGGVTLLTRMNNVTLTAGTQAVALVVNNAFENVANTLTLQTGAQVAQSFVYSGGGGADVVSINGPGAVGVNAVDIDRFGNNSLTVTGNPAVGPTVGGGLVFVSGDGNDNFTLSGAAVPGVYVDLENGTNVFNVLGSTVLGDMTLRGGAGTDTLSVIGSTIDGSLNAHLSSGTNAFTFDAASTVQGNLIYGGFGSNTVAIANEPGGSLQIRLAGGPATVNLSGIATPPGYVGSAILHLGLRPGPKSVMPP